MVTVAEFNKSQAAKSVNNPGYGSVSSNQGGGPAGMTFGEAASVGTTDEITGGFQPSIMSQQEAQQAQQQINQNQPATADGETAFQLRKRLKKEREEKEEKEEKSKKGFDVIGTIQDFYDEYKNFGGIMGLGLIPFKLIAEPTVATFQNPQALATLKLLFDEKGQKFKDEYLKDHVDIISEAYANDPTKEVRGLSDSEFFDEQLQEGAFASEQGILGAGSQEINFPAEFYTGEKGLNPYGAGGMPQTTGGLANLASLDASQFASGDNYNPEMVNMIFAARAELDRMGKNYLTGNPQGGGGGQGIMGVAPPPTDEVAPKPPGSRPPSYPIFGPQPPFMPGPLPFPLPDPTRPPYGDKFERPRPYNYFAQSPQYRFRGIPSVNTDAFNEELRKRFGMA